MNSIAQNTKITSTDINVLISELNGKLNLSGGTITGGLTVTGNVQAGALFANKLNGSITLGAGVSWNDAPSISLYGPNAGSGVINGFSLRAGAATYSLNGYSDGSLLWTGYHSYLNLPQGRIWSNNSDTDKGIVIAGNTDWNNTGGILCRGGQSINGPSSVYIHSKYGDNLNEFMLQPTYSESNRTININTSSFNKLNLIAKGDYIDTNPSVSEIDNQLWFTDNNGVGMGVLQLIHRNSGAVDFLMTCRASSSSGWKSLGLQLQSDGTVWTYTSGTGLTFGNGTSLWIA